MVLLRRAVLLGLTSLLLLAPAAAAETARTIGVAGQARLEVPNDAARVVLGVRVRRATAPAAVRAVGAQVGRVLAVLTKGGVASGDLATRSVSVRRAFRRGRFLGYDAATTVRATVRRPRSVSTLVPAAVAAGATSVDEVTFFLADRKAAFRFALAAAFDDARAKAQILAARAGLILGAPLQIREGSVSFDPQQQPSSSGGSRGAPAPTAKIPTRPGTTAVQADVSVLFEASTAP